MSDNKKQPENKKKSGIAQLFSRNKSSEDITDLTDTFKTEAKNDAIEEDTSPEQYSIDFDTPEVSDKSTDEITVLKEDIPVGENAFENEQTNTDDNTEKSRSHPDAGSTAVFTIAKENPTGTEHQELNLSELEDSAKSYFNATHTSEIDEKINELCKLADSGFEDRVIASDIPAPAVKKHDKQGKKKNKKARKDVVSNDDIELLSSLDKEPAVNGDANGETEPSDDEMLSAFGMKKYEQEEIEKRYSDIFTEDEPDAEYTDVHQDSIIIKELRGSCIKGFISVILTLIVTVLCGYFETAAGTAKSHPAIFEYGRYGVVFALSMLQLMFFAIIFNLDGVKRAFKGLVPSKMRPEGLTAITIVLCTLHTILSITLAGNNPGLVSYCTVGCLSLLFLSVNSFIKNYTCLTSFCIAASKKPKFSTTELDATSSEAGTFAKYLDPETAIFTVTKNSFIKDFFKKSSMSPKASRSCIKLALIGVAAGIVCGIISGFITSDIYRAVTVGFGVALAALPVNMLIATALPHLIYSLRASKTKTAFIGEAACDAYTEAGILSFDDTEVFPPRSVKVSSIRTYGDNRIDKVIIYMAKIFETLGGPLSFVFANSLQGTQDTVGSAQVIEHCSDGVRIKLDGKEILLGTSNFFRLFGISTPGDNIDESFLQSLGSIMYMSADGELAAKFYIKYTINAGFEDILKELYNAGICVGIKTFDPCINTSLVTGNLKGSNYPISVIKKVYDETSDVNDQGVGSIISLTGIHSFLGGFAALDKLRNLYRSNVIVGTVCALLSIIITSAVTLTGAVPTLSVSFFIVLQLVWCLPTIVFSALNK